MVILNKYNNGSILKTVINLYPNHLHTIHPTEKPVKLMEILIELVDNNLNYFLKNIHISKKYIIFVKKIWII